MSAYTGFDYRVDEGVGTVTFTRPDTLNSLTFEIYAELERLAWECQSDDSVRVLVLTGAGKGFCSGGDVHEIIGELGTRDVKGMLAFTRMTGAVVRNLRLLEKPVVASINGIAAGAGVRAGPRLRLPDHGRHRPLRVPLHEGGPHRRRHGRGVPPPEGGRARAGDGAPDARGHDRRRHRRALRARHPRRAGRAGSPTRRGRSRAGSPTGRGRRSA